MKLDTRTRYWGSQKIPQSKSEFFNAVTTPAPSGEGRVATIRLYGPIDSWGGYWGISTKDMGAVLDALPDSVDQIILRINSPGGEVFEGMSILNMLRAHKATVTAVVDGRAASAASVIASGCDENVMSPGTQMMIHSPSVIDWGNAAQLRKTADILDGIEASIIEIYQAKAGDNDWSQLLADETWLTAAQSVEIGLADRIAVIPDAGETRTAGVEDEPDTIIILPSGDDDADDLAAWIPFGIAAAHRPPSSPGPVESNQKKEFTMSDALKAGLRERLGITDADASEDVLLAAVNEVLEQATTPTPPAAIADTAIVVDKEVFTNLQNDAAAGRAAREEQITARRDGIIVKALAEGRITPANRDAWRAQLDANEDGTAALLASLPSSSALPLEELGLGGDPEATAEDRLYNLAFGEQKGA